MNCLECLAVCFNGLRIQKKETLLAKQGPFSTLADPLLEKIAECVGCEDSTAFCRRFRAANIQRKLFQRIKVQNALFLKRVANIPQPLANHVKELTVVDTSMQDVDIQKVIGICTNLQSLHLARCTSKELFSRVCRLQSLQVLQIQDTFASVPIQELQALQKLQMISLRFFFPCDTNDLFLSLSKCSSLQSIHLTDCGAVSSQLLTKLKALSLKVLSLCNTPIGDKHLEAISEISSLEVLDLRHQFGNLFTFQGLQALCKLEKLRFLVIGPTFYDKHPEIQTNSFLKSRVVNPHSPAYFETIGNIVR